MNELFKKIKQDKYPKSFTLCNYCNDVIQSSQHKKESKNGYYYHEKCFNILKNSDPEFNV